MVAGRISGTAYLIGDDRRKKLFLALILLVPFISVLLLDGYVTNTDETWQLQAASRLTSGKGYTCSWKPAHDLGKPKYDHLIAWPPGYSIVVAGLLKTGFSMDSACKFVKLLLVILGVIFWSSILDGHLETDHAKYLLLAFLVSSAICYARSPTDLAFWGFFPLMLSCLSGGHMAVADSRRMLSLPKIIIGSLTVSVLILFRYQGLVLIPIGTIWLLMFYRRNFREALFRISLFLFLPVATYLFIMYTNVKYGGASNIHTNAPMQGFSVDWRYISGPLKAVVFAPLQLDKVVPRILHMAGLDRYQVLILDGSALFGAIIIVIVLVRFWKRSEKSRVVLQWFTLCLTCLIGFLGVLTMFYFSHNVWVPIEDSRYYWFLFPLLATMLLMSIESKEKTSGQGTKKVVCAVYYTAIIASWLGIIGYSGFLHYKYAEYNREKAAILGHITSTSTTGEGAGRLVVANNPFINMVLWDDFVPAYRDVELTLNKDAHFSNPTFVYMVEGEREKEIMPNLASQLQMKKDVLTVDGNSITIYRRRFEKGLLFRERSHQ